MIKDAFYEQWKWNYEDWKQFDSHTLSQARTL